MEANVQVNRMHSEGDMKANSKSVSETAILIVPQPSGGHVDMQLEVYVKSKYKTKTNFFRTKIKHLKCGVDCPCGAGFLL